MSALQRHSYFLDQFQFLRMLNIGEAAQWLPISTSTTITVTRISPTEGTAIDLANMGK